MTAAISYILIYWIFGGSQYSISATAVTGQATFSDQASCQAALAQLRDDWSAKSVNGNPYGIVGGICAPSATPAPTATP